MRRTTSGMVTRLIAAFVVMALCVVVHASGLTWTLRRIRPQAPRLGRPGFVLRVFTLVAIWLVLLHLSEIALWAWLFHRNDAIGDLQTAFYFSMVTYTTTGYGDVVLPPPWRLAGGVEALCGILMCGWSAGFFFALVNRVYEARSAADR